MRLGVLLLCLVFVLLSAAAVAQMARVAPLPSDPLELATGPAKVLASAQERASVLAMLERVRQNNALHTPGSAPFKLKASFDSSGQTASVGPGELEETWMTGQRWRWTARMGRFFQTRVFYNGQVYDEKSPGAIPLRLQMARNAIFWPVARTMPGATIRATAANWKGTDVLCVLFSRATAGMLEAAGPGRIWQETEYCVDPKSGRLMTYSEAPGIYTSYDYGDALQFNGRTLARQITVVEDGSTVLTVHLDSISDPGAPDAKLFLPTQDMLAQGPGAIMTAPFRFPQFAPAPAGYAGEVRPVIVHAIVGQDGKVLDAEALQTSDAVLSRSALDLVRNSTYPRRPEGRTASLKTGEVARQYEVFINVQFVPQSAPPKK